MSDTESRPITDERILELVQRERSIEGTEREISFEWDFGGSVEDYDAAISEMRARIARIFRAWLVESVDDPERYTKAWTQADIVYDGWGTRTLREITIPVRRGTETWRLVATPNDAVTWQHCRYSSGLRPAFSPLDFARLRFFTDLTEKLCPVCGVLVKLQDHTKDGRLVGTCGDAFTMNQWDACPDCGASDVLEGCEPACSGQKYPIAPLGR
jgi:ribosomal protein S27AE